MTTTRPLAVGIIGAGGFARFVAEAIETMPELRLAAVADRHPERAAAVAPAGANTHTSFDELLADPDVEAVIISTKPRDHAELSVQALRAGKHVFCEKPAGVTPGQMAEVSRALDESGRGYVIDHVVHHNPLVQLLHRLARAGVLGQVQRFVFENDAGDSGLGPDHWFWDREVSGGILLEHGVHFFDVARLLVDSPEQQATSLAHSRPDGRVDTVVATIRHENGALATHWHGFSHADDSERQRMRVDYGLAEARLEGWIPLTLRLEGWLDAEQLATLESVTTDPGWLAVPGFRPGPRQQVSVTPLDDVRDLRTHDEDHAGMRHVLLEARLGEATDKQEVYRESVRAALMDLVTAANGEQPSAGLEQGAAAVEVAHAATLGQDGSLRPVVRER